eukprot:6159770-Pyramimonas_sp.AAC.1
MKMCAVVGKPTRNGAPQETVSKADVLQQSLQTSAFLSFRVRRRILARKSFAQNSRSIGGR